MASSPGSGLSRTLHWRRLPGLQVDDGIVVDTLLRTSHPDIYAAGDVANFANPALGKRLRVEHEDNANTMGNVRWPKHGRRARSLMITCPSSTRISSTWATKRWVSWTHGSRWSRTGRSPSVRACCTICGRAGCAACCCGTSGSKWMQRGA